MIELTYQSDNWLQTNNDDNNASLLVLDASFNPPTKAHMALIQATLNHCPPHTFTGCLFLFTTNNVDKMLSGASPRQRLDMMTLLAEQVQMQVPTAVGTTSSGRFVDKAKALSETFGEKSEFSFIVGHDTMVRLLDPKYYPDSTVEKSLAPFFQHSRLICVDRPGFGDIASFWDQVKENHPWLSAHRVDRIVLKDEALQKVSSTLARSIVANHQPLEELTTVVDSKIANYILQHKLYL